MELTAAEREDVRPFFFTSSLRAPKEFSGRIFEPRDRRTVPAHDPKPRGEALRGHLKPESFCVELFYLSKIEKLLRCLHSVLQAYPASHFTGTPYLFNGVCGWIETPLVLQLKSQRAAETVQIWKERRVGDVHRIEFVKSLSA